MSTVSHGRKIETQLVNETEQARQGTTVGTPDLNGQGGAINYAFPTRFDASSKRDQIVRVKQQLMNDEGMSKFGRVTMSDADVKWLLDKQKATEEANFQKWFADTYNTSDVATRTWAQKVNPEFYSQREKLLLDKVKLATRIKLIELRGPKTEEDLITLYGLRTGRLRLEPGWDKVGLSFGPGQVDDAVQQKNFREGLERPTMYPSQAQRQSTVDGLAFGDLPPSAQPPFGQAADMASPFMDSTPTGSQWNTFMQRMGF